MIIKGIIKDLNKANKFEDKMHHAIKLVNEVNSIINLISSNEIEDIINILEDNQIEVRQCTNCSKLMFDGYVVDDGHEYYCSDKCFDEEIGMENLNKMYEDDEAYWTEFN